MTNFLTSFSVILVILVSFWGWGSVAARLLYGSKFVGWFYPASLGMVVVVVLGGIGNLLQVASPPYLWVIVIVGCTFAAAAMRNARLGREDLRWLVVIGGMCLAVLGFLTATLMPSSVFNRHDDFLTYFVRPIRMLQTGSVGGVWFDLIGYDALGAQSFLQSFLLLFLPVSYINGFDGILCMTLAIALTGELSRRLGHSLIVAVFVMTILVLIDPQIVNVSAIYAGTMVILGLFLAVEFWNESMATQTRPAPWRPAIAIGLFLAALVALKVTLAIFAFLFAVLWLLGTVIFYHGRKGVFVSVLSALLATALALAPWIVLHATNLLTALTRFLGGQLPNAGDSGPRPEGVRAYFDSWNRSSFYGGTYSDYSLLVAGLSAASVVALFVLWRRLSSAGNACLISVSMAGVATVAIYLAFPYLTDTQTAIRYTCPVLLAVVPYAVAVTGSWHSGKTLPNATPYYVTTPGAVAGMLSLVAVALLFGDAVQSRAENLLQKRTLISYPVGKEFIDDVANALGSRARDRVQLAQGVTRPGAGILASVRHPFHMDFARNSVQVATEPALMVPWLDLSLDAGVENFRGYLVDRGVDYIIWERAGPGIRTDDKVVSYLGHPHPLHRRLARATLRFRAALKQLADNSTAVFTDDQFIVLDVKAPPISQQ